MSWHLFIDYIDVLGLLGGVVDFFHPSTYFKGTVSLIYFTHSVPEKRKTCIYQNKANLLTICGAKVVIGGTMVLKQKIEFLHTIFSLIYSR